MREIGDFKPRKGIRMNNVMLIGRVTRKPEIRYTQGGVCVANFSLAINRGKDKEGKEQTDFPRIVCFSKTGEIVEKYVDKGSLIGVSGRISTSSYEKDGKTIFDTRVVGDRIELLEKKKDEAEVKPADDDVLSMFSMVEDDEIPF